MENLNSILILFKVDLFNYNSNAFLNEFCFV